MIPKFFTLAFLLILGGSCYERKPVYEDFPVSEISLSIYGINSKPQKEEYTVFVDTDDDGQEKSVLYLSNEKSSEKFRIHEQT